MLGKRCVGVVCSNMCKCMIELCRYLVAKGVDLESNLLLPVQYDNLGLKMIIYFPNID